MQWEGSGAIHTLRAGDDWTTLVRRLLHSAVLADGLAEGTHLKNTPKSVH